ncbi:MAG: alpha/beta fold hydrolase, partial [Alphaproteobacteria bacterium]|nr:alpha/beta fold hydrolase [Alphaproteobacteria bacterium]
FAKAFTLKVTMDQTRHEALPAIAAAILKKAPARFALCGLSMGGYVALEIMRQAPERVTRLALLDTSSRADTPEQTARRRGLLELADKGQFKGVTPRLLPLLVHPARLEDKPLLRAITAMASAVGKDGFFRQQRAIMARVDSRPGLPKFDLPSLVLVGRRDALTPVEHAEEMAGLIPGARLAVIEHCGHMSTMEMPETVNRHLEAWLKA